MRRRRPHPMPTPAARWRSILRPMFAGATSPDAAAGHHVLGTGRVPLNDLRNRSTNSTGRLSS